MEGDGPIRREFEHGTAVFNPPEGAAAKVKFADERVSVATGGRGHEFTVAPADGDIASPHLTGATIDIAKKGLSLSEVAWMRAYLLPLQNAGKIDVEEEFYQSCFHITVYKSYAPPASPRSAPHQRGTKTALIAAGVQ